MQENYITTPFLFSSLILLVTFEEKEEEVENV